ncbi:diacylglycerol kinase [Streptomyces sp. NPDC054796]
MVIDPAARLTDGESVRIARDVLCAGAPGVKVCVPDNPEEIARAFARRGARRPVVIGDDLALLRAVQLLHGERKLSESVLSVVPVGAEPSVALTRALGVPPDAVGAARAALGGAEQWLDLLVDDSGGVVLGGLRIPGTDGVGGARGARGAGGARGTGGAGGAVPSDGDGGGPADSPWRRACRSLARTVLAPQPGAVTGRVPAQRLRVEADGELLADWDRPVEEVSVSTDDGGMAEVTVRERAVSAPVRARARAVTVAGPEFRYRAGCAERGPVRGTRTWTVVPSALRLMVPMR